MKHVAMVLLILLSVYSTGCAAISSQVKEIAMASAEKAATRAIESGKIALSNLVVDADATIRSLGTDFVATAKQEIVSGSQVAAFKLSETVGRKLREQVPAPTLEKGQELIAAYLASQGQSSVGPVSPDMSMFQKILLGLAGTAGTAVTGVAGSQMSKNKHDRRVDQKRYEQDLRDAPPPVRA